MKTIPIAISIIALVLSGCAHTGYQRGYVSYNSGYAVQRYYDGYDRSYYSPGTRFSYGQYYVQPRFGYERREYEHHHDRHYDWRSPVPRFNHHGSGYGGWQNRGIGREFGPGHHAGQAPYWGADIQPHHQRSIPGLHGYGFGGNSGDGGRQHHGWHGRHHGERAE